MSDRLRDAYYSEGLPPGLDTRVRAGLQSRRPRALVWTAAAAAVAAGFFGFFYVQK